MEQETDNKILLKKTPQYTSVNLCFYEELLNSLKFHDKIVLKKEEEGK